jgi:hypothetical protein
MSGSRVTRREFAASLAAAAAAACVPRAPRARAGAPAAARAPDPNAPATEALSRYVGARYGKVLPADQLKEVRRGVRHVLELSDALRAAPVSNADDPYAVWHYVGARTAPAGGVR